MSDASPLLTTGRFQPKNIAGQIYGSASGLGGLRTAQLEQSGLELTRAGRRFRIAQKGAITGIAPVQAVPTTAAQWTLFNADANGQSAVIETLGVELASGTSGAGVVVMGAFFTLPAQVGSGTNIVAQNMNGSSARVASTVINSGVTITAPTAPQWFVVAKNDSANTAVLSCAAVNEAVNGRIVIPPQFGLALATLSPAGTSPLWFPVCEWTEYALDLE